MKKGGAAAYAQEYVDFVDDAIACFSVADSHEDPKNDTSVLNASKALSDRATVLSKYYAKGTSLDVEKCTTINKWKDKLHAMGYALTVLSAKKQTAVMLLTACEGLTKVEVNIPEAVKYMSAKLEFTEAFNGWEPRPAAR